LDIRMKKMSLALILIGLYGCNGEGAINRQASLNTSAQHQLDIQASEYAVQVVFMGKGEDQKTALDTLAERVPPFESWAKEQAYSLTGGAFEQFPRYDYRQSEGRQLIGYEARQTFHLKGLSFSQYQDVISQASRFKPDSVQMMGGKASEADRAAAQQALTDTVFNLNRQKAEAIANSANLCGLSVQSIQEQSHSGAMPRMMKMEMADVASIHGAESKQTLNLTLMVEWKAYPCD